MEFLPVTRLGKLRVVRILIGMFLTASRANSILLLTVIIRELDDLIDGWETECQLQSLVAAKQATAPRTEAAETPFFDDGDHLVEDQM